MNPMPHSAFPAPAAKYRRWGFPLVRRAAPAVLSLSVPLSLALSLALLAVLPHVLPSAALADGESIQIFRPLDANKSIFLENDDGLLTVPGGRMFLFQVEISALNPLLEVRINGSWHSAPRTTWTFVKLPQLLRVGQNRIVVEARTGSGQARQEFMIELKALPGFRPKPSKPAS